MSDALTPPPHAIDPEKSVLSSILQDYEVYLPKAREKLGSNCFYRPSHGKLFTIFCETHRASHAHKATHD